MLHLCPGILSPGHRNRTPFLKRTEFSKVFGTWSVFSTSASSCLPWERNSSGERSWREPCTLGKVKGGEVPYTPSRALGASPREPKSTVFIIMQWLLGSGLGLGPHPWAHFPGQPCGISSSPVSEDVSLPDSPSQLFKPQFQLSFPNEVFQESWGRTWGSQVPTL